MRRSEAPAATYTVEISPPAWKQLAHLTSETYERIRHELDGVATALSVSGRRVSGSSSSKPVVLVDDSLAVYDVDHDKRRVVLREVTRRK
jgi:mRNA-degrading endonuclease RelE of RelBE toxin-antitoxin system